MNIPVAGGEIAEEDLGITLAHEHVVVTSPETWDTWPEVLGPYEQLVATCSEALRQVREKNSLATMIDPTTPDLGRNVPFLEAVAARSGVNLVLGTGSWARPPLTYLSRSMAELGDFFIREISEGFASSARSRAAVIKVACGEGVSRDELKILRAAAHAQLATGVPIIGHGDGPNRSHETMAAVFESLGVAPDRVCLGHIHDSSDRGYLAEMAERGYWLGFDRFPGAFRLGPAPAERIDVLAELIDSGYGPQISLSHDWSVRTTQISDADERDYRERYNPDGFNYLFDRVVPALNQRGIADALQMLFIDNPRRFLTGAPNGSAPAT